MMPFCIISMSDVLRKKFLALATGIFFIVQIAVGQYVTIQTINVYGLKKTKDHIVYRELTFEVGDSVLLEELATVLERNKSNLLNLGIFNEAEVNLTHWNTEANKVDVVVEVRESWYIYAVPILDLADRNFNVWWTDHNHSLERINLGARLDYLNFSGRNDKLKAALQIGYTPKQQIEYRFPYFNKRQSLGLTAGFQHSSKKEIDYITIDNKELFAKIDERRLQNEWKGNAALVYRPSIYLRHEIAGSYSYIQIDEAVLADFNPLYFRNGEKKHAALSLTYSFEYDDRDIRIYPTSGVKAGFEVQKIGWGKNDDENILTSTISMEWNHSLSKRLLQRLSTLGRYSLSRSQPSYHHYEGLGNGQKFIRGYELYVIDALDFMIIKYQLSYKVTDTHVKWGKLVPMEEFRNMPLKLFISMHGETGFSNDPFTAELNPLSNQWLFGGGLGLNVLIYNNFLFQLNMNVNHLGEKGFYIHNQTSF